MPAVSAHPPRQDGADGGVEDAGFYDGSGVTLAEVGA